MRTLKGSKVSSDPQQWNKVFNSLVHILETQQIQLESLSRDRKFLEDRIKLQYDRWVSDVNLFQDQISQMKTYFAVQKMVSNVEAAKSDLEVGQKQREGFMYKIKLDNAASELADFREWFDYLSHKCCETNDTCSEMLALLSERDCNRNQYKKRESDLTDRLESKSNEVERANEKIQKLLTSLEQLQLSNSEKDSMILTLKTNIAELEATSITKSEEISRLSREMKLLRKARSNSVTPVLRGCLAKSRLGDKDRGTDASNTIVKKESHPSQVFKKGCGSSKRKLVDANPVSETPKLFTSAFKVPKLKNSSCHANPVSETPKLFTSAFKVPKLKNSSCHVI
ncbi:unnamed protein product [Camellia sinensis]